MSVKRVVMVVDMQQGVFATPRYQREKCVSLINQLTQAAERVIFIQHTGEGGLEEGSEGFDNTALEAVLREQGIREFVICGCATDYCVDATIKNGVSRGYHITVAEDAHTTANRPAADAPILINHYNDVWRDFIAPANPLAVKRTETILENWKAN